MGHLETGLANVAAEQQSNTAATNGLRADIQQLLGQFQHMVPSQAPALGNPTAGGTHEASSAASPPVPPTEAPAPEASSQPTTTEPAPVAPAKGKTGKDGKGVVAGAGAFSPC